MTTETELVEIISQQALDEGLWFIPQTATEDYLQRNLRLLHADLHLK